VSDAAPASAAPPRRVLVAKMRHGWPVIRYLAPSAATGGRVRLMLELVEIAGPPEAPRHVPGPECRWCGLTHGPCNGKCQGIENAGAAVGQ
jgi:hypothetical protein